MSRLPMSRLPMSRLPMSRLTYTSFAAVLLAATMSAPASWAQVNTPYPPMGPYIAGQIGYNTPTGDGGTLDDEASYSAMIGYRANPNLRIEGEISYRKNDYGDSIFTPGDISGRLKATNFMANAWYDFTTHSPLTPYLGGGIGAMHVSAKGNGPLGVNVDDSDTVFVWQIGGGASYGLTRNVALTADYRYMDSSNFSLNATAPGASATIKDDYRAHEIRIGARYSF